MHHIHVLSIGMEEVGKESIQLSLEEICLAFSHMVIPSYNGGWEMSDFK